MKCQLCDESLSRSFECDFCRYSMCEPCAKRIAMREPVCPSCSQFYSKRYASSFDKEFLKEFEEARFERLMKRELVLLHETENDVKNDDLRKRNEILKHIKSCASLTERRELAPFLLLLANNVRECRDIALAVKLNDEKLISRLIEGIVVKPLTGVDDEVKPYCDRLPSLCQIPSTLVSPKIVNFLRFLMHMRDTFNKYAPSDKKWHEKVRLAHMINGTNLKIGMKAGAEEARYVRETFRCLEMFVDGCAKWIREATVDEIVGRFESTMTLSIANTNAKLNDINACYGKMYKYENRIGTNYNNGYRYNFPQSHVENAWPTRYLRAIELGDKRSECVWWVDSDRGVVAPKEEANYSFGHNDELVVLVKRPFPTAYL